MNKPIIIDGVNVSGCAYHTPNDGIFNCNCEMESSLKCLENLNCYYKQLQRVISENEKLLKELQYKYEEIDAKGFLLMGEDLNFWKNLKAENEKYKQALEEIRDCINVLSMVDNDFKGSMVEWKINKILNEVLKDAI